MTDERNEIVFRFRNSSIRRFRNVFYGSRDLRFGDLGGFHQLRRLETSLDRGEDDITLHDPLVDDPAVDAQCVPCAMAGDAFPIRPVDETPIGGEQEDVLRRE